MSFWRLPTSALEARHRGSLECSIPEARLARNDVTACVLDVNFRRLKQLTIIDEPFNSVANIMVILVFPKGIGRKVMCKGTVRLITRSN